MMSVLEVLNAATSYLQKQGVESPRLNAEHLLAHTLGMSKRMDLYLAFDRPLGEKERAPLRDLVKRRSEGVPLQHLLGTVEFLGHEFLCDPRGLIPRPETEELVELVLKLAPEAMSFLDVGTGSGVIALSLAIARPTAKVAACDISKAALALTAENRARLGLEARIELIESDLLSAVDFPFEVILANLPYIPSAEIPALSREVRHDPVSALDGGPDGLQLVERLADELPSRLVAGGLVALEIGHDQAERVIALLAARGFKDPASHADHQGHQRFVTARKVG
jgi:release factor glutamine methyltransferase